MWLVYFKFKTLNPSKVFWQKSTSKKFRNMVSSKHGKTFMYLITIVHLQQKKMIKCLGIANNIFGNANQSP